MTTSDAVGEDAAPPLGLAYLAATLLRVGHKVILVDALGEALDQYRRIPNLRTGLRHGLDDDDTVAAIPQDAQIIGVSIMFSLEWPFTRELVRKIRAARPRALIIAGGEHITALPEFSLDNCEAIDICVLGEGEQTLVDLLEALEKGEDLKGVNGLCIRRDGTCIRTVSRKRVRQIDELPRPAWELTPLEAYLETGVMTGVDYGRSMPIMASRGCPYRCTFCSNPVMWGPLWRARSPDKVVAEIEDYCERYGVTNFDFYDLTAIVKRSWIVEFCTLLIAKEMNITWQLPSGTRSEALDEEVCRLLYASGCRYINYAPESGSEEMLMLIKKQISKPAMMKSIRGALREGLNVKANFILGFPTERVANIWDTFRWIIQMALAGVQDISVFPFSPYPGSALFSEVLERREISLEDEYFYSLSQYTDPRYTRSYCHDISKRKLRLLCLGAMAAFYLISYMRFPGRIFSMFSYLWRGDAKTKLAAALIRIRRKRKELVFSAKSHVT